MCDDPTAVVGYGIGGFASLILFVVVDIDGGEDDLRRRRHSRRVSPWVSALGDRLAAQIPLRQWRARHRMHLVVQTG